MSYNSTPYNGKGNYIFTSYSHSDAQLIKRILDSSLVIVFFSENYMNSNMCVNEIKFTVNNNKDIVCVNLEKFKMRPGLQLLCYDFRFLIIMSYLIQTNL